MGDMLQTALTYIDLGWHIFPAPIGTKRSHIAGLKNGGARWGASNDPATVRAYWQRYPDANIGIPTGALNGIWCLDIDTTEGHGVDGFTTLANLVAQHGPLPDTLTAESPTGSRHLYWQMPKLQPGQTIRSTTGVPGPGMDLRGDGGMVLAPPSRKPDGGVYRWLDGPRKPVAAPEWLLSLVISDAPAAPVRTTRTPAGLAEIEELLSHIHPDAIGYDGWREVLAAIHQESGGSVDGLSLADAWSERGEKYRPGEVAEKWQSFRVRGDGNGIGTIGMHVSRAGGNPTAIRARHSLMAAAQAADGYRPAGMTDAPQRPTMPRPDPDHPKPDAPDDTEQNVVTQTLELISADPDAAVRSLAGQIAALPADDRDAIIRGCKPYGIVTDMRAAIRRARESAAADAGNKRYESDAAPVLSHYYIVENEGGVPVAIDSRGDMHPQSRASLRDALSHLPTVAVQSGDGVKFVSAVDHWWSNPETPRYAATGYDPLSTTVYTDRHGRRIRNVYQTGHIGPPVAGDVEPFLYILRKNVPDDGDRAKLLQFLGHVCQRPGVILRWAVVMQGAFGCGKGAIARAVEYCHGPANTAHPSPDVIARDFNDYMFRKTLILVDEIGDHTRRELSALAERIKPWITDSPVHIEPKGRPGFDAPNYSNWIFTTNHMHCMLATPGERRYMHIISPLQTKEEVEAAYPPDWWQGADGADWWRSYHQWLDRGGAEAIRAFLLSIPLEAAPSRAPETTSTAEAQTAGDGALQSLIRSAITAGEPGFRGGWVSGNAVRELTDSEDMRPVHGPMLAKVMRSLGYAYVFRARTTQAEGMRFPKAPNRTRLYHTHPRDGLSPSQATALYEAAQESENF